jgi:hypothetical protein
MPAWLNALQESYPWTLATLVWGPSMHSRQGLRRLMLSVCVMESSHASAGPLRPPIPPPPHPLGCSLVRSSIQQHEACSDGRSGGPDRDEPQQWTQAAGEGLSASAMEVALSRCLATPHTQLWLVPLDAGALQPGQAGCARGPAPAAIPLHVSRQF